MDLVGIIFIIALCGWLTFYAIAFSLYLIEHLSEILDYYGDRRRSRRLARRARANLPQPSLDEDLIGVVLRDDAVPLILSPSVRAEFETPPITLSSKSEPTGSLLEAATAAYQKAVLSGTATINDYRRLQDAVDQAVRS